jgi:hypothetical protein
MIGVGPLFFGGTRGGYGRTYMPGSKAANREVARVGRSLAAYYVAKLHLPGGGVPLICKRVVHMMLHIHLPRGLELRQGTTWILFMLMVVLS